MTIAIQALKLARLMKSARDNDAGNFGHYFPAMNETEWNALCDRAEILLPSVKVSPKEYADWAKASRDFRAEQRSGF